MRITIIALCWEDELVPLLHLGVALQGRGHAITCVTDALHASLVASAGLLMVPLQDGTGQGEQRMEGRQTAISVKDALTVLFDRNVRQWGRRCSAVCRGVDLVIGFGLTTYVAACVAEAVASAFLEVVLSPRPFLIAAPEVQKSLAGFWMMQRKAINMQLRPMLGLTPYPEEGPHRILRAKRTPMLCAFDSSLVARCGQLPAHVRATGFIRAPKEEQCVDPVVRAFCTADIPFVYVGFGKGGTRAEYDRLRAALEVVHGFKLRALVVASTGARNQLLNFASDVVMFVEEVSREWVLQRARMAIHQGGVSVVAEVSAGGIPSIVLPSAPDEHTWGQCLAERGIALTVGVEGHSSTPLVVSQLVAIVAARLASDRNMFTRKAFGDRSGCHVSCLQIEEWFGVDSKSSAIEQGGVQW